MPNVIPHLLKDATGPEKGHRVASRKGRSKLGSSKHTNRNIYFLETIKKLR